MDIISEKGRTAVVYRVKRGLVCKSPRTIDNKGLQAEFKNAFAVERQLLERLGNHPRIVQYYGTSSDGLLLSEADCGDLQSYMNKDDSKIDNALRKKWSLQAAEALAYVHKKGIIHSNISLNNVLIHKGGLILADFGGSRCRQLDLDGHLLPDPPFFDPHLTDFDTPKVDVFSLGILLYIINTGQYPFHQGLAPQDQKRFEYENYVEALLQQNKFPSLSGVQFKDVIAGCCCERRFESAEEVVVALKAEMRHHTSARLHTQSIVAYIVFLVWVIWAVAPW